MSEFLPPRPDSRDEVAARRGAPVGRRRLLLTGLAGLGVGAGGGYAYADRDPVPSATAACGPAPTGGDDSDALQAAVDRTRRGMVLLPPGHYRLSRSLTVPAGVQLAGSGGFPASLDAATTLSLTTPAAGLRFVGGGNGARDLAVVGRGVSTAAVTVGGTGPGDIGADCFFQNVAVSDAAGTGWLAQGVQNSTFINCRVQDCGGDGLVFDLSAGGHLFERFECGGNAGANLRILQSRRASAGSYAIPADNTFVACIFEKRRTPGPCVTIDAADTTTFLHCAFACLPGRESAADASALIEVRSGRLDFVSPVLFVEGPGRAGFGVHGGASAGPTVAVSGLATISGGAGAFADVDATGRLLLLGAVLGLHADDPAVPTTLVTPRTPPGRVGAPRQPVL